MSQSSNPATSKMLPGGLAAWLLQRLKKTERAKPRLALVERLSLTPRHSVALIEAEGRKLLVATAPESAPAFYALDSFEVPALSAEERPFAVQLRGHVC